MIMSNPETDIEALRREVTITTLRGSGPGGQHRNKVETAVRIVHIPTGITVLASEHRSQYRNRELAFERLRDRLIARNKRPKPRTKTRRTRASIEKRLERKRRQAQKKHWRRQASSSRD